MATTVHERLQFAYVAPQALLRAPYNPRQMSAEARAALKRGIETFGFVDPVVARAEDRLLLGGHQRLTAAEEIGLAEVPVVYVAGVSDQQAAALNVLLNNPSAQGTWDMGRLSALLSELDANGFDATLTGFDNAALEKILAWEPPPECAGDEREDVDLSVPAEPNSEPGVVYELGRHRLMCGDATNVFCWDQLMGGAVADLVWTDPPYGVSYVGKTKDALTIENDSLDPEKLEEFLRAAFGCVWTCCRPGAAWYVAAPAGPLFLPFAIVLTELRVWRQTLQWIKDAFVLGRSDYHYRHEAIFHGEKGLPETEEAEPNSALVYGWKEGAAHSWAGGRKQDTVWEVPRPKRSADHPTMKPVDLVRRALLNSSQPGDRVIDAFGGSGTTLVAAAQTGRVAYLMELDPRYCDVIRRRYADLANDPGLAP